MDQIYTYRTQVFYEDTDFTGVVYYANYLKYFERGREFVYGVERLQDLYKEKGLGFAVYRVEVDYKTGATFGETLEVKTRYERESSHRVTFHQEVWNPDTGVTFVKGIVRMVCLDANKQLQPLPIEPENPQ